MVDQIWVGDEAVDLEGWPSCYLIRQCIEDIGQQKRGENEFHPKGELIVPMVKKECHVSKEI